MRPLFAFVALLVAALFLVAPAVGAAVVDRQTLTTSSTQLVGPCASGGMVRVDRTNTTRIFRLADGGQMYVIDAVTTDTNLVTGDVVVVRHHDVERASAVVDGTQTFTSTGLIAMTTLNGRPVVQWSGISWEAATPDGRVVDQAGRWIGTDPNVNACDLMAGA